jgi:hypothetical protein
MARGVDRDRAKSRRENGFAVNGATDPQWRMAGDSDSNNDNDKPSLTAVLFRQLFEVEVDGKTNAQHVVDALIQKALEGDIRAYHEIYLWIDGEAKSREAEPVDTARYPGVDERTAQKILEVFDDYREARPGH